MNTPFLDEVYEKVDFDRELVYKFFTVFSLFEYALKRAGFLVPGQRNEAKPDWERFAREIEDSFDPNSTEELSSAVSYMLGRPVMKQIKREDSIIFIRRIRPHAMGEIIWLSILIRGVRNNLFHGGKFLYERPRDTELIQNSLIILEAWAHCDRQIEQELRNVH